MRTPADWLQQHAAPRLQPGEVAALVVALWPPVADWPARDTLTVVARVGAWDPAHGRPRLLAPADGLVHGLVLRACGSVVRGQRALGLPRAGYQAATSLDARGLRAAGRLLGALEAALAGRAARYGAPGTVAEALGRASAVLGLGAWAWPAPGPPLAWRFQPALPAEAALDALLRRWCAAPPARSDRP